MTLPSTAIQGRAAVAQTDLAVDQASTEHMVQDLGFTVEVEAAIEPRYRNAGKFIGV